MYQYAAKLQHVVDGDTVDLTVDLGFTVSVLVRFRLYGIDAPEMKSPTLDQGKAARAHLEALLANAKGGIIYVDSTGRDKYGRWLARLSFMNATDGLIVDVSTSMITGGFAVPYVP